MINFLSVDILFDTPKFNRIMYFSAVGTIAEKYALIDMPPKRFGMGIKGEFCWVEFILESFSLEETSQI